MAMPRWVLGWDVFCWLGHRRFARHWSVPQIRADLADVHQIHLSPDGIERYIGRYQRMVAARQQDASVLAQAYRGVTGLILSIDGLQPEKGHETLYVVREVGQKRAVDFQQCRGSSPHPDPGAAMGGASGDSGAGVAVG